MIIVPQKIYTLDNYVQGLDSYWVVHHHKPTLIEFEADKQLHNINIELKKKYKSWNEVSKNYNLSENIIGINSSKGTMDIMSSEVIYTTKRASTKSNVIALCSTYNMIITNKSNIVVNIVPESGVFKYVDGLSSTNGNINVSNTSSVSTYITGYEVRGIYAKGTISVTTNSELMLDVFDASGMGAGIYSNAGDIMANKP